MAQIGCGVAQIGWGVAQIGCGVAQTGCGVAQIGCGVAQTGCGVAQLGCGVAQIVAHRLAVYGRPEFESRLGTPGGGPLPSRCNEDNKSGSLRVVYINIV